MKGTSSIRRPFPIQVFCNGALESRSKKRQCSKLSLEYRQNQQTRQNISLHLPEFITSVFHLPDRVLDLLEIAGYVFCADRHSLRGSKNAVEYHAWSRDFEYFIKVRDYEFWKSEDVKRSLGESLTWMTGDRNHKFNFLPGHSTARAHIFDAPRFSLKVKGEPNVVLFSGGLDSLAGVIELLEITKDPVWLISHKSGNPSTGRTQNRLIGAMGTRYPKRVNYRVLECHLHGVRAPEESQRTRAFLYCSMGFAMATALKQSIFYLYENGITALNFSKRGAMLNARTSRTAHPKTIRLMKSLFCLIAEKNFDIRTPFAFKTKTEVVHYLKDKRSDLINSAVSCSKTYKELGCATHCGQCSQCIDRKFAVFAAECDDSDDGIYATDFINQAIENVEEKTGLIDYLRQARQFLRSNLDHFYTEMSAELSDAIDTQGDEFEQVESIHSLCQRHARQVQRALQRMILPLVDYPDGSLATILEVKDFCRPPAEVLARKLASELEEYIRRAFVQVRPKNENDLNAKIDAFLSGHRERFQKEFPCLSFATARIVPDHSDQHLWIEAKYVRGATTPSKATQGIAEDLTKYPDEWLKLFIVYDPEGQISDRTCFKKDFEAKRYCIIHIA